MSEKINVEQLYAEYQQMAQQMQLFDQQIEQIANQTSEFLSTLETLNELPKAEDNNDILVPISSGIFIKAKLTEKDKVLVNVGSSVSSEKTVEETKKLIEEQINEMENIKQQILQNRQLVMAKLEEIQSKFAE